MDTKSPGTTVSWLSALVRRHPAAVLPAGTALSDPPQALDPDTAKVALEQVNKRLDAELALKSSTETRALTLAGQCTTLLSAITAAVLVEGYGSHRPPLMAAGIVGVVCLLTAVIFAYNSAQPRNTGVLPGRLPDELWDDLIAPGMKGPEFMGRLMLGLQDAMVQNELNQVKRARALANAVRTVRLAVPLAFAAALVANPVANHVLPYFIGSASTAPQSTAAAPPLPAAPPIPPSGHLPANAPQSTAGSPALSAPSGSAHSSSAPALSAENPPASQATPQAPPPQR
jgi:hypothetical protein